MFMFQGIKSQIELDEHQNTPMEKDTKLDNESHKWKKDTKLDNESHKWKKDTKRDNESHKWIWANIFKHRRRKTHA